MIRTITSLRTILALMIFLSHSFIIDNAFSDYLLMNGYVAVTFFFIISGFVISYNYQQRLSEREVSYKNFFSARLSRLYPVHILTLLGMLAINFNYLIPNDSNYLKLLSNITLTQAFIPSSDFYFSYNSVSWCLSTEMFFYLLFPFFAAFFYRNNRIYYVMCSLCISVPILMLFTPEEHSKALWYINPIARSVDFLLGIMVFALYEKIKNKHLSYKAASVAELLSVLVFVSVYVYSEDTVPKAYTYSVIYWLPAMLIILFFSLEKGMISKLLQNPYLVKSGEYSLCFYMVHMIVIVFYKKMCRSLSIDFNCYIDITVIFIISCICSFIMYRYFELPVSRFIRSHIRDGKALRSV